jgi:peptidoglycan L-alanyl-D-glutamate endopeptidase CwlK
MVTFDKVDPRLKTFFDLLAKELPIVLTFGFRSVAEQDALYAIGRTKPGKKVTNAKGGQSKHNFGKAIDVAPLQPDGKIDWKDEALWNRMVAMAKKVIKEHNLPIKCGADFKTFQDRPHFEIKE